MLVWRENRPSNNLSTVFKKRPHRRPHRNCSNWIGDTNVDILVLMTSWCFTLDIDDNCSMAYLRYHFFIFVGVTNIDITILNNTTETADEAINKHIDRGCSLKAYKSVRNRWVAHIDRIWVIVYESFYLFIQYESHGVTLKLNFEIFTCMFVKLETIMKFRNRKLKGRVSSPSFMVSEK